MPADHGRKIKVAVVQCALGNERAANIARIESLVEQAASDGAQIVLPPELFERPYFPQHERDEYFAWARAADGNETIARFATLARRTRVVVPVSFFEKAGPSYYNSVAVIDATGDVLGIYRKSHIPDGPCYEEKFYFRPGDTGFRAFKTQHGTIGVGICWDQWFPEAARAMALLGAEILLYPTAIGSEPEIAGLDTREPWQRAMIGHAVSNAMPVAAANRVGKEDRMLFYGSSFIANERGDKVAELGQTQQGVALAEFDLAALEANRAGWGFFRDRRPELYSVLAESKR